MVSAGGSQLARIAEWIGPVRSYCPTDLNAEDSQGPYVDVNKTARLVSNRWGYVFSNNKLFMEVFVAEDGLVSLLNDSEKVVNRSITERNSPNPNVLPIPFCLSWVLGDGKEQKHHYVRVFLSRVRLTERGVDKLLAAYRKVVETIPPLWSWHDLDDLATVDPDKIVASSTFFAEKGKKFSEGRFALYNPRTTLHDPQTGRKTRVFVGWDPFTVAETSNRVYVRRLNNLRKHEKEHRAEAQKHAFGRVLINTVGRGHLNDMGLNGFHLTGAVDKFEKRERALRTAIEKAAASICQTLDSKLCRICVDSAVALEGVPEGAPESQPLRNFYVSFDACTTELGASQTGSALLRKWAIESESDSDHFISTAFFLTKPPAPQHFKTFRWASKAILSFISQCVGHKIAQMKGLSERHLAGMVKHALVPLVKQLDGDDLALWKKIRANPGKYLDDIDLIAPMRDWHISKEASITFQVGLREPVQVNTRFFQGIHDESMTQWLDMGNTTEFANSKRWLDSRAGAMLLLDTINLAVALVSLKDKTKEPLWKTIASTTAVATGVLATLIEEGAATSFLYKSAQKKGLKDLKNTDLAAKRFAAGLRVVVSLVYAVVNTYDAVMAVMDGNYKKAAALTAAAFGEILCAAGNLLVLFSVRGAVVGVWIGVIGGLVAAGGYITAALLTKTPLQKVLRRCEWGQDPYSEGGPVPMQGLKGDYQGQLDLFFRLLCTISGVRIHRSLDQKGVALRLAFVPAGAYLRTTWVARFHDDPERPVASKELRLNHARTQRLVKGSLEKANAFNSFGPPAQWFGDGLPVRLTFFAELRGEGDVPISTLQFTLTEGGSPKAVKVHDSGASA